MCIWFYWISHIKKNADFVDTFCASSLVTNSQDFKNKLRGSINTILLYEFNIFFPNTNMNSSVGQRRSCNFTYMNIYISFSKVTLLCIIKDRHCNFCFWKEVWIVWVILYLLWLFYKKMNMILWNNWGNTSRIKSVIAMFKNWKFKFDFYYLCFTLRIAVYSCLLQEWQYSLVLINHITFIKWSCLIHLRIENWCL